MISKLLKYLANFSRLFKGILLFCFDAVILGFSMLLAFAVRFDPWSIDYQYSIFFGGAWLLVGLQILALMVSGLYRSVLRPVSYTHLTLPTICSV